MSSSRLTRFVVVLLIGATVSFFGLKQRSRVGREARRDVNAMLAEVDGYLISKSTYDTYAESAHEYAMDQAYAARREEDQFDRDLYIACFFDQMVALSEKYHTKHMAEALRQYCQDHHISRPGE